MYNIIYTYDVYNILYVFIMCIVNEGKKTHFLLNFTLNKIKLAQIMNN